MADKTTKGDLKGHKGEVKEKVYSKAYVQSLLKEQKKIVILFGSVYDLTKYIKSHPGGQDIINSNLGKDAT